MREGKRRREEGGRGGETNNRRAIMNECMSTFLQGNCDRDDSEHLNKERREMRGGE